MIQVKDILQYTSERRVGGDREDQELYGLEIEVEEHRPFDSWPAPLQEDWTLIDDGSLRNGGSEFVSRPLTMDELRNALPAMYRYLEGEHVVASIRTSTHVHVNMLARTLEEVRAVVAFHVLAEPLLYSYVGVEREQGIYCVPFYRAPREVDIVARGLSDYAWFDSTCKYSGLYTYPLRNFGTMEWRMAPFWPELSKLLTWLEIIQVVCTAWKRWPDVDAMIDKCEENPWAFFEQEFGELLPHMCVNDLLLERFMDDADCLFLAERVALCTYKAEAGSGVYNWNVSSDPTPITEHAREYWATNTGPQRADAPYGSFLLDEEFERDYEEEEEW